jgi:sulfate adenylyltransferase
MIKKAKDNQNNKLIFNLDNEKLENLVNMFTGVFHPVKGFMDYRQYRNVVDNMMFDKSSPWPLPITLDVDSDTFKKAKTRNKLYFRYNNKEVGYLKIVSCYEIDSKKDLKKIFKTSDPSHPGVKKELAKSKYRIGGKVMVTNKSILKDFLIPKKIKAIFAENKWKTIIGFHTRNPVHRAHEYLQRIGLETCDGLFINPVGGWKKSGDFTNKAIMGSYRIMIKNYYPKERICFRFLKTSARYAGPREAIFTAIIRRNLGCTHFIIGRDHTGVGSYYDKYEAHELADKILRKSDLGINLLLLKEPYFCKKCNQIVTEKNCGHGKKYKIEISGTKVRRIILKKEKPDERFLRPEVASFLISLNNKFIK